MQAFTSAPFWARVLLRDLRTLGAEMGVAVRGISRADVQTDFIRVVRQLHPDLDDVIRRHLHEATPRTLDGLRGIFVAAGWIHVRRAGEEDEDDLVLPVAPPPDINAVDALDNLFRFFSGVNSGQRDPRLVVSREDPRARQRAPRSRAPQAPVVPYSMEQMVRWLTTNAHRVTLNTAPLLALIAKHGYGCVPILDAVQHLQLSDDHVKEVQDVAELDIVLPRSVQPILTAALQPVMFATDALVLYLQSLMKTGKPDVYPEIKGFKVELVMDTGAKLDITGGFPRLTLTSEFVTVSMVPFGLMGTGKPVVTSIGGTTPELYAMGAKITFDSKEARLFAYWLSRNPKTVVKTSAHIKSPFDHPLEKIKDFVTNFHEIAAVIAGADWTEATVRQRLAAQVPARTLTQGGRFRLLRYLKAHPELAARTLPNVGGNLPYAIEDYIPDEMWRDLPKDITQYAGPVLLGNPYVGLPPGMLEHFARTRRVQVTAGKEAEELHLYDEIMPDWRNKLLASSLDNRHFTIAEMAYYMQARGLKHRLMPEALLDRVDEAREALRVVFTIIDAGGIGKDEKTAMPNIRSYIDSVFTADRSRLFIEYVCEMFGVQGYEIMLLDQLRDVFARGYINPLPVLPAVLERWERWKSWNQQQRSVMTEVYGFPSDRPILFATRKDIEIELESWVNVLDKDHITSFVRTLGMMIPSHVDSLTYIRDALPLYRSAFHRTTKPVLATATFEDQLLQCADNEIIRTVNAYYGYGSRRELVDRAARLLRDGTGFFLPIVRNCTNKMTLDFVNKTDDPSLFLIAFGTLKTNICYQLSDLLSGFNPYGETNQFYAHRIVLPDGKFAPLTLAQAAELRELMITIQPQLKGETATEAKAVVVAIDKVNDVNRGSNKYSRETYAKFRTFASAAQTGMRAYFTQMFFTGMYMRRWEGVPSADPTQVPIVPYPLAGKETRSKKFNADGVVGPQIERLRECHNNLVKVDRKAADFMMALRQVENFCSVSADKIVQVHENISRGDNHNIRVLTDDVARGNYCIRMASTYYIGTATYYLKLFFDHTFPGYDPKQIEQIS